MADPRSPSHGGPHGRAVLLLAVCVLLIFTAGCRLNDPYRSTERGKNIFYTTFNEPPKHLDPARSYSSDEYSFLAQIYEPPLQYHYLIRPYRLVPLTADSVPAPVYYDSQGKRLPENADPERV
ncbi:MAG TPA: peptide ABC transporter substrate-binding protein, partial [Thermodesulfobacteriota bacterium]|nr:peptide ABC transporter substrate-binding protein [Thermodesulfobacteriota bacterium]